MKAGEVHEESALASARSDVERLETALAAATHQRDRKEEEARLATEGVSVLEQRIERLRQGSERELAKIKRRLEEDLAEVGRERQAAKEIASQSQAAVDRLETDLADARRTLKAKEKNLDDAEQAVQAGERDLAALRARLEAREEEFERIQAAAQEAQRELTSMRESLVQREQDLAAVERKRAKSERKRRAAKKIAAQSQVTIDRLEADLADAHRVLEGKENELAEERNRLGEREEELQHELREEKARLDEVLSRLEAREHHLKTAQIGIESRDHKLAAADRDLGARDAELERLRAATREYKHELEVTEARLEKSRQRTEYFRASLIAIREGRAYRLMRILWKLRRPFKREARDPVIRDDDVDSFLTPEVAVTASPIAPQQQSSSRLTVASILDEMSEACFAPECDLVPLTLEDWREQLDEQRPDLLLVESAWNGNGGEWKYRIAKYPRRDLVGLPALRALLDNCRERGIPTAFWNKEDPVHFDRFSEAATLFDHVFTTDSRCVQDYRDLPGERTVTPLPFAAQPRIHNPIAVVQERSTSPCFAGAWYRDRHPDRRRALEVILDAARPYGLVIYDRSFGGKDAAFGFPERFGPHVLGRLPYDRILDVYKSHRVFLNANSVVDSPTMCSRRVFELAACDTVILSTPGAALSTLFGDVIVEAGDEKIATEALERLLGDEGGRALRTRAARRAVFAKHTYADRLATIVNTTGLESSSLRGALFAVPSVANGVSDSYPWLLKLRPGVVLSEPALADIGAAATFADADVIGTRPSQNGNRPVEHQYVSDVDPRAVLVRRELVESRGWPSDSAEEVEARLREWGDEGVRIYAADSDLLSAGGIRPVALGPR